MTFFKTRDIFFFGEYHIAYNFLFAGKLIFQKLETISKQVYYFAFSKDRLSLAYVLKNTQALPWTFRKSGSRHVWIQGSSSYANDKVSFPFYEM